MDSAKMTGSYYFKFMTVCLFFCLFYLLLFSFRGHGGTVVTHSPPTSEVGGSNPAPYVENLVVPYRWSAVYSTEP